jgi:hypothetical protein
VRAGVLLMAVVACREPPRPQVVPAPARAAAVATVDAGWALTPALLDSWVRYHRQLRSVSAQADAGLSLAALARLELTLRRAEGLTEGDVDRIEALVSAVVVQRSVSGLTGGEAVREFEKATVAVKPELRAQVEKAFGDVKQRAQQSASLEAERALFGDGAVSLVLSREAEVTEIWNGLLDPSGGGR